MCLGDRKLIEREGIRMRKKLLLYLSSLLLFLAIVPIAQAEEVLNHYLFLGVDARPEESIQEGRSDTIVLVTERKDTVELTSIPRDIYIDIPGYRMDKVNHAYAFGGADLTMETIEQWLEIDISNYVALDMMQFIELVDEVGGVTVFPPTSFEIGGYSFVEGEETPLDGPKALAYVRERYTSGGDYGRQGRQLEVISKILLKLKENKNLTELVKVFKDSQSFLDTDFNLLEMAKLVMSKQPEDHTLTTYQLEGSGEMIDGIYYEMISDDAFQVFYQRVHQ